jgi:hypothetical protein
VFFSYVSCDRDWGVFKGRYGEHKSVSALLSALREDRATLDKKDANAAKEEEDFGTFYLTRSEGDKRRLIMKKNIDIARQWRARYGKGARWWHSFT